MVNIFGIIKLIIMLSVIAQFLPYHVAIAAEQRAGVAEISKEDVLRLGERIYREGILPSGKPVDAIVQGDIPVEGSMFSCESCHLRSGLGSYEGGILTIPTNGKKLFEPYNGFPEIGKEGMGEQLQQKRIYQYLLVKYGGIPRRPAYTDETLAVVLRDGMDPAGRVLDPVMPRYLLDDRDMAVLISYLKSLSSEPSPGVLKKNIRFATVITEEVSKKERDEMLATLDNFVKFHEKAAERYLADFRPLSLARWELKGPRKTWRAQLEEYYRKEPVFALLGGITTGEWRPIHEFSEEHKIPCLFPITDFPVISSNDWYTLYFSKGLYQEGEAAARFLMRREDLGPESVIVQVYQDTREGRAFAAGFNETWSSFNRPPAVDKVLPAGAALTKEFLQQLTKNQKPSVLLIWQGGECIPVIEPITNEKKHPGIIFLSASLLKDKLLTLPDNLRDTAYITYPYWLPRLNPPSYGIIMNPRWGEAPGRKPELLITDHRITYKMITLVNILCDVLMEIRSNFYRDYVLDLISEMMTNGMSAMGGFVGDSPYERVSFGPGQRYAAKGCNIVQLTHGPEPMLEKKSDWVIH
jgi:hypothetical protein